MLSVFENGTIGLGVPPLGGVVSRVKLSEVAVVLPKVSVWLATMASVITVEAIGVPSTVRYTTVLASPVPLSASFEVMASLDDVPKVSLAVTGGAAVLTGKVSELRLALLEELEMVGTTAVPDD